MPKLDHYPEATTITTISAATEKLVEEMARELFQSEEWKRDLQEIIRKHFRRPVAGRHRRE